MNITPHCRKDALKLAQQEEWLSQGDWLISYSVLERVSMLWMHMLLFVFGGDFSRSCL